MNRTLADLPQPHNLTRALALTAGRFPGCDVNTIVDDDGYPAAVAVYCDDDLSTEAVDEWRAAVLAHDPTPTVDPAAPATLTAAPEALDELLDQAKTATTVAALRAALVKTLETIAPEASL